jgi:Ferredoxin thioredoxin reductase catalytic beta chain.
MKIVVNPSGEFVRKMCAAIKDNDGYCPCSLIKNADTKCMCKEFREQDAGVCHCGLYTKIVEGE